MAEKIKMTSTRDGFGEGLLELGRDNKDVVVLSADLTDSTRAAWFKKQFPDRFFGLGVAEQDMFGAAAGFALMGKIPFACTFGVFASGRAWDQIRVSIAYMNLNVKIAGTHGGISVGPDGATHQAIEEIGLMRIIPNMTIIVPCDALEAKRATIEAAKIIRQEGLAKIIVLTPEMIDKNQKDKYIEEYYQLYQSKDIDLTVIKKLFEDNLYYAAMMTRQGQADGLVAGAAHTTADIARACIRCIGLDERFTIASSCFIMDVPNCQYGENGTFIFADCGVIPDPNARQLSCIAFTAAELAAKVLDLTPRVAFLSYSTKGSAKTKSQEKISEALGLLKELSPTLLADGELQGDSAIVPEVADIKCPESPIKGRANVLVFPNLEAGNISYKLVQRLSGCRAIGPLFLGLNKPASDLSRGCFAQDIVDSVAVTAIRAH